MKPNWTSQRTATLFPVALLFLLFGFSSCVLAQAQETPDWVAHADAANKAFKNGNLPEADKEAKFVLDASNHYGGKVPPSAPLQGFQFFPDPESRYPGSLIILGSWYEQFKKWNDAEQFYREALKLETIEFGASSPASTIGMPALIDLLKKDR